MKSGIWWSGGTFSRETLWDASWSARLTAWGRTSRRGPDAAVIRITDVSSERRAGRSEKHNIFSDARSAASRSEEHTSELQSLRHLVCRLLLEKKKKTTMKNRRQKKKYNANANVGEETET